jgi:putative SOS response-associated peptidase YedK
MCNRYVSPDEAAIERYWHIGRNNNPWRGQTEIFPRGSGPFIRAVPGSAEHERELVVGQWGLIPWFAKTAKLSYSTNNARFEEIASKASFKHPWLHGSLALAGGNSDRWLEPG